MGERDGRFEDPHLGLSRIYTRTGDSGDTALVGGQRVPKDSLRIEAYGTVDELNAIIGLCRTNARHNEPPLPKTADALLRVQHQLFNLGSILATLPADVGPKQPRPTDADIAWLEQEMDARTKALPTLTSFVLPGPPYLAALLHQARTVCRRAERIAVTLHREGGCSAIEVRYLNRLSDALFVWSRAVTHELGFTETLWQPNKA